MSKVKMMIGAVCALGLVTGMSHAAPKNGAVRRNPRPAPAAPNPRPNYSVTPDVFTTNPYNFKVTPGADNIQVPEQYGYKYTYAFTDAYGNLYYRTVTLPYPPYYFRNNNPLLPPNYYGYGNGYGNGGYGNGNYGYGR